MKQFLALVTLCLAIVPLVAGSRSCNMTAGQKTDYKTHMKQCLCTEDNNGMKTVTCQNSTMKIVTSELYYFSSPFDKWNIHELILDSVDLSTIDGTTAFLIADFYKGLKSLTLNHCMIPFKNLKTMYSTVKSLETLKITCSYNETSLNKDIFIKSMKNLTQFSFRGGSINSIGLDSNTISSYAPSLQVLNLDGNNFTQFPTAALKNLRNLTVISLVDSSIKNIDNNTVSQLETQFPNLQTLNLDINCTCDTFYSKLRSWVTMNVTSSSVQCRSPDSLANQDINVIALKSFCVDSNQGASAAVSSMAITFFFVLFSFLNN